MVSKLLNFFARRSLVFATVVVGVTTVTLIACNEDRLPPTVGRQVNALKAQSIESRVVGSQRRRPTEDRFVQLANEIPGFAGFSLSPTHELVVFVKDTTEVAPQF